MHHWWRYGQKYFVKRRSCLFFLNGKISTIVLKSLWRYRTSLMVWGHLLFFHSFNTLFTGQTQACNITSQTNKKWIAYTHWLYILLYTYRHLIEQLFTSTDFISEITSGHSSRKLLNETFAGRGLFSLACSGAFLCIAQSSSADNGSGYATVLCQPASTCVSALQKHLLISYSTFDLFGRLSACCVPCLFHLVWYMTRSLKTQECGVKGISLTERWIFFPWFHPYLSVCVFLLNKAPFPILTQYRPFCELLV